MDNSLLALRNINHKYIVVERKEKMENKKIKYIDPELVKIANSQDVFDILKRTGEPLKKVGREYRHREHDSLVVTPGKGFYWFSKNYGSKSPINYFEHVHELDFVSATTKVLEAMNYDFSMQNIVIETDEVSNPLYISNDFILPERADDNKRAFAYLVKTRHIDKDLVSSMMRKGIIYQSKKYNNLVFLGKDYEGNIASAFTRTTLTKTDKASWTRGDARGSKKEFRFRIENRTNKIVNVFESEIDMLSYLSMQDKYARNENYVSLGGVTDKAILKFLENRTDIEEINICTDNDEAGHRFASEISQKLGRNYHITRELPIGKDFNEDLVNGLKYSRNRIDMLIFDTDTLNLSRKEKIEYINKLFSEKYQGMEVNLTYPTNLIDEGIDSKASINYLTRKHFIHQDKIEKHSTYQKKLSIGIDKDLIEVLEKSKYTYSKKEEKREQNSTHKNTYAWHYFKKEYIVDDKLYNMVIDVRESVEHKTYVHKIRLKEIEYTNEHEKMVTPTGDLMTTLMCGRLPFDVSDDNTKEAVNQEEDIEF